MGQDAEEGNQREVNETREGKKNREKQATFFFFLYFFF